MKEYDNSAADKMQKNHLRKLKIKQLKRKPTPDAIMVPSDQLAECSYHSKGEEDSQVYCGAGAETNLVFGHASMVGKRSVMEDTVTVAPPVLMEEKYSFFAVYDGHGGAKVAEKCREKMHMIVAKHVKEEMKSDGGCIDWKRVMAESFRSMEAEIEGGEKKMGSTVMVVLIGEEEVVVAIQGWCSATVEQRCSCQEITREDEKERIEAAGGMIINWNGWRVQGVLSTSRSLGDEHLKPYVCSEPEVNVVKRTRLDEFLIIGTDGLFDVVANEVACDFVKRCLTGKIRRKVAGESRASEAATLLAKLAMANGSEDNISVIVVQMK